MLEISDNKVWEITKILYNAFKSDDQAQRLDPDNLKEFKRDNIKPLYPHKVIDGKFQKYSCCESCCSIDPGRFCCCSSNPPDSSFKKLGLGLCLYFKFMKHSSIVFIMVALLTIISCFICYWVSVENDFSTISDYQTFLFSTTLGVFSSEHIKCSYQLKSNAANPVTLNCPYGRVNFIGTTYSSQSSNTLYNCNNQIRKFKSGDSTFVISGSISNCSYSTCSITSGSITPNDYTTIAYSYECLDQNYILANTKMKSHQLLYVVVGIDLFCCLILALFYFSEQKAEDEQIKYFKKSQLSLNDFSLKIKGLNVATFNQQFDVIVKSLTKLIGQEVPQQIVQVKTPDRIDFVEYQNKKNEAYQQLYEYIVEEFFDHQVNPSNFKDHDDFINRNFSAGKYEKYRDKLIKYISQYHFLQYVPDEQKAKKQCSIFIVLNTIGLKNSIYQNQKDGCFKKYYSFNNKQYILSEPPPPDLIIWKNKGKITFIRMLISWILTLAICMGSYMLFGYIQYKQNSYLSTYNFNINCKVLYTTIQLKTYDTSLQSTNYLTCYCMQNLFSFNSMCNDFQKTYITYLAIPAVISLLLVIYNVIVSSFFRLLSRLQAHRLVTTQLFSYTIKRSFLLVMNMALIMIILNMKYSSSLDMTQFTFLLQGKYSDITPDWYINIGSIIILTMIFNITFPIIELMLANTLKCLKKCWDRKLFCKKTSCKTKNQYKQLYVDDIYPIEQRYAFLISVFLITLSFSSVIPILNLICAISLILLYFADKVLVFKVYQTPANYGPQLHSLIGKVIYLGLIAHFSLAAFFLSENNMIASYSYVPKQNQVDSTNPRINSMISVYYIIPYVILFLLFAGWSFFDNTVLALCEKCQQLCKKNLSHITKYKLQKTFYQTLSSYQLLKLKLMTQSELSKLTAKQLAYKSIRKNKSMVNQTIKGFTINLSVNESFSINPVNQHQGILRRTQLKIKAQQTLRKRQNQFGDTNLLGLPSYQIMVSDQAFQQNRKNNYLSQAIHGTLHQILQSLHQ